MTLIELGSHARHLADAVLARNWLAVFNELPAAQKAIAELIEGWANPQPHVLSATPEQLAELGAAADDLAEACKLAAADVRQDENAITASAIDPGKLILFLELAQLVAEMIRRIRDRRAEG